MKLLEPREINQNQSKYLKLKRPGGEDSKMLAVISAIKAQMGAIVDDVKTNGSTGLNHKQNEILTTIQQTRIRITFR